MSEVPENNSRQNSSSSGTSGLPQGIVDRIMENVGNMSERSQSEPRKSPLPDFLVPHIMLTRMSERVGKWAHAKISRKESAPEEATKERATLSKITDMLIDPKKIFAVVRLKLVDELGTFLVSHDPFIREKTAIAISEIARRPTGRQAIIRNPTILSNLINGLQDVVIDVRIQMARVLEILAHDYFSAKVLVENYRFLDIIAQSLSREQREILVNKNININIYSFFSFFIYKCVTDAHHLCQIIYLSSLEVLLLAHVNVCHAIEIDMIETLLGLLNYHKRDKELLGKVLSCLVLLCQDSLGTWKAFEVKNFLSILTPLLNDDAKEIHEKAASLIAFATITNYGKINGLIFIDRLLELANNGLSRECRLMSIKALTNIAEVPEGREELLAHLIFIEHINTGRDRVLKKHKNILLKVIQWHP
ncbi:radial spoke head 14 homolog isoform X1 [Microplitis mediator]|uniref:radial spoke head 14 homolog isoform X1 n=1 Tax=Microplitis mediator TaxID=375433 RepID=UPI00255608EB|nr:radial spoke head 14 homolog isoform X1 [Microplitis mediator]